MRKQVEVIKQKIAPKKWVNAIYAYQKDNAISQNLGYIEKGDDTEESLKDNVTEKLKKNR